MRGLAAIRGPQTIYWHYWQQGASLTIGWAIIGSAMAGELHPQHSLRGAEANGFGIFQPEPQQLLVWPQEQPPAPAVSRAKTERSNSFRMVDTSWRGRFSRAGERWDKKTYITPADVQTQRDTFPQRHKRQIRNKRNARRVSRGFAIAGLARVPLLARPAASEERSTVPQNECRAVGLASALFHDAQFTYCWTSQQWHPERDAGGSRRRASLACASG